VKTGLAFVCPDQAFDRVCPHSSRATERVKVLPDENPAHRLRTNLGAHEVFTVGYKGWAGLKGRCPSRGPGRGPPGFGSPASGTPKKPASRFRNPYALAHPAFATWQGFSSTHADEPRKPQRGNHDLRRYLSEGLRHKPALQRRSDYRRQRVRLGAVGQRGSFPRSVDTP
jgi:hypothetical protein